MKMFLSRTVFFCVALVSLSLQGKSQSTVTETIDIQLNADFFVTGENLLFKLYCHNAANQPSAISHLAYVELIDANLKPVFQTKISLVRGEGSGYFFIPSTIVSGNFSILVYTQWMRNFGNISTKEITIVNPLERGFVKPGALSLANTSAKIDTFKGVSLEMKSRFHTREEVEIQLKNLEPGKSYRLSASVIKSSTGNCNPFTEGRLPAKVTSSAPVQYLPDLRGEVVSGRVLYRNTKKPLALGNVSLAAPALNYLFLLTQTDSSGYFNFNLDKANCVGVQFLIRVLSEEDDFVIEMKDKFLSNYEEYKPSECHLDSALLAEIKSRSIFNQIENIYFTAKKDSFDQVNCASRFYGAADKVYELDKFTRFQTLEDILRELIPEIVVSTRDKILEMKVRDNRNKAAIFPGKPLLLLDGIPVSDQRQLFDYDVTKLKRIEIVTKRFYYSTFEADGIVSFETYQGNAEGLSLEKVTRQRYVPVQVEKNLYSPNYPVSSSLSRVPDYRIQLYWNPKVDLSTSTSFKFFTSDIQSEFILEVRGYSSDGKKIYLKKEFKVGD